jgi:monoamine oxidase
VELGAPVFAVEQDPDGVTVRSTRSWRAKHVICTVPPPLEARIDWSPALPLARRQLVARLPMSAGTKVFAAYEEPFWRSSGLSGQALTDGGPVQATFDNSPPAGAPGVLMGFVEGSHAASFASLSEADRRRVVLEQLARWFGPRALCPIAFHAHAWSDEAWSLGCLAHLPTGAWTRSGPALRAPVGRVHWASAESSPEWPGYMEGALRSGVRAARDVLAW